MKHILLEYALHTSTFQVYFKVCFFLLCEFYQQFYYKLFLDLFFNAEMWCPVIFSVSYFLLRLASLVVTNKIHEHAPIAKRINLQIMFQQLQVYPSDQTMHQNLLSNKSLKAVSQVDKIPQSHLQKCIDVSPAPWR